MSLSKHFTLAEFTDSDTATRNGIDNTLPDDLLSTAQSTADMLEGIRSALDNHKIQITSGYRCLELNTVIGSGRTSDHVKAMAVDFKCPGFGTPYDIARRLALQIDSLGIGQIIAEFGAWVHVSTRIPDKIVNRVITIDKNGTRTGVQR